MGEAKRLRIYLHPADYGALAEFAAELGWWQPARPANRSGGGADIARGGCRLKQISALSTPPCGPFKPKFAANSSMKKPAFSADGAGSAQSV